MEEYTDEIGRALVQELLKSKGYSTSYVEVEGFPGHLRARGDAGDMILLVRSGSFPSNPGDPSDVELKKLVEGAKKTEHVPILAKVWLKSSNEPARVRFFHAHTGQIVEP